MAASLLNSLFADRKGAGQSNPPPVEVNE